MLVGAGLVSKVRTCYFGLEIFGLAPNFTTAANKGELDIIEESEASLACGIRAQLAGVGFIPSLAWQGTDMFSARPDVKLIEDPYTGEQLTAFPAISCDVAVIHVLKADRSGNCVLGGNPTIDLELATMATTVIITAEEVVEKMDQIHFCFVSYVIGKHKDEELEHKDEILDIMNIESKKGWDIFRLFQSNTISDNSNSSKLKIRLFFERLAISFT